MKSESSQTKITIKLDTRSFSKLNSGHPIRFRLYHQGTEKYLKTNCFSTDENWVAGDSSHPDVLEAIEGGKIIYVSKKHPKSGRINNTLKLKIDSLDKFMSNNEKEFKDYSPDELKTAFQKVADELDPELELESLFRKSSKLIEAFNKAIELKNAERDWGTKKTHEQSLETFKKYFAYQGKPDVKLVDIDKDWVNLFDAWYSLQPGRNGEKVKPSSRQKKLAQLLNILKIACEDKEEVMTWANYEFHRYKLPSNKAAKRSIDFKKLDHEELAKTFDMNNVTNLMDLIRQLKLEYGTPRWHYRNYLLFIWDCRGMDFVDLAFLKRKSIFQNTLEYSRTKLKEEDIAIIDLNEEAMEILEFYKYKDIKPNELVFPLMREIYEKEGGKTEYCYERYQGKVKYFNKAITKMLQSAGLDHVTSKMIRHTWAQNGYEMFESRELISEGLLHKSVETTKVYAKDLARDRLNEVNEAITERKSKIITITNELQINLFQHFHKGKSYNVGIDEFRNRVLKKIRSYEGKFKGILNRTQLATLNRLLVTFSNTIFIDFDDVENWIKENLKKRYESHGIRIITSDYNL